MDLRLGGVSWRRAAAWALLALPLAAASQDGGGRLPLPVDWSHRHVIFANPDTPAEARAKGRYAHWLEEARDPRFLSRVVRKLDRAADAGKKAKVPAAGSDIHRDWSVIPGGAGGAGVDGIFPAKYNFDISSAPSCANDFVVLPTASAGATMGVGAGAATLLGTVSGNFANGKTVTINNNGRVLTLTSSGTSNSGLNFLTAPAGSGLVAVTVKAANLAAAIDRNGASVGVSATSNAGIITVTATTRGTFGNSLTATEGLAGLAWAAGGNFVGGSGTSGQPTVIAYNNLYSSCATGAVPSVMWSYNTGTGEVAGTSPVLSLDGSQVAFVQATGAGAKLVLLKWSAGSSGTASNPDVPPTVTNAAYRSCAAPCMTSIAFSGSSDDALSSPYYDYSGPDQLWVGGADGTLHRFTGVFDGTPVESGSPWPVTVAAGQALSSPVYDGVSGLVFVGSERTTVATVGGRLHSVDNSTGVATASGLLAGTLGSGSTGVTDAPILDSLAKRVYAHVFTDVSTACGGKACNAVYQFSIGPSISGLTGPVARLGRGDHVLRMFSGVFDEAYYESADFSNPSGFLYVCGGLGNNAQRPTLWRIPIVNNTMGTPVVGPTLVGANVADAKGHCSPITQIANGSDEFLYVSVPDKGNDTGCANACIYSYNIRVPFTWGTAVVAAAGLAAPGGTGGIVIDNTSSMAGASQVYYLTRGATAGFGTAVQASQAGLN